MTDGNQTPAKANANTENKIMVPVTARSLSSHSHMDAFDFRLSG